MRSALDRSMVQRMSRVPESGDLSGAIKKRRELPLSRRTDLDEALVVDPRSSLRPAQLVERKLMALLKSVYLPVSHVRATTLYKGRGPFSLNSGQSERKLNSGSFAYAGQ